MTSKPRAKTPTRTPKRRPVARNTKARKAAPKRAKAKAKAKKALSKKAPAKKPLPKKPLPKKPLSKKVRAKKPPANRPAQSKITPALVAAHGLKPDEYARLRKLIGRTPTFTELGIFSAMWNEHCSYKSSKIHLRTLPTKAPWWIQGPGENAGVIDIGDGLACVFKMESHNHPSYIEPYQG